MKKDSKKRNLTIPPPTKAELEAKAKYEEFWSDPCWTEPLETSTEFSSKALL